jgi:MFS family permease
MSSIDRAEQRSSGPLAADGNRGGFDWGVLFASAAGMGFSQASVIALSFGVFIYPLTAAFGWSRSEISLGLTLSTLTLALVTPFTGQLLDKWGPTRLLPSAAAGFTLCLGAMALLNGSLMQFYLMMVLLPLLGAGSNSLTYTRVVSRRFQRRLGLALGIAMSGVGLVSVALPPLAQAALTEYGWRATYLLMALLIAVVQGLVIVYLRRHIAADDDPGQPQVATAAVAVSSLIRQRNFVLLAAIFLVFSAAITATNIHLMALLRDRGIESQQAAYIVSFVGVGLMLGRVVAGLLMDWFFAPRVALLLFLFTAVGMVGIYLQAPPLVLCACAFAIGVGSAAEMDLMAFMTARYFGPEAYGRIYGLFYLCFMLGASVGPFVMGLSFEQYGDYQVALLGAAALVMLACVMTLGLGSYRYTEQGSH